MNDGVAVIVNMLKMDLKYVDVKNAKNDDVVVRWINDDVALNVNVNMLIMMMLLVKKIKKIKKSKKNKKIFFSRRRRLGHAFTGDAGSVPAAEESSRGERILLQRN